METSEQKENIRQYFDGSENWREKLYVDNSHPFNRLLTRRKEYAFTMLNAVPELKRGTAVDIGCGPGDYVEELMKRGFETFAIDISTEMLNVCRMRLNIPDIVFQSHFKQADIENIPFNDQTFDVVICVGVLGLLTTDDKALGEILRVLKPGGLLLLAVENIMSLSNIDYFLRDKIRSLFKTDSQLKKDNYSGVAIPSTWWIPHNNGIHYKLYNPWKLNRLINGKGFHLMNSMTAGYEFRVLRRMGILPETMLSKVEIGMEKLFRKSRLPYFSYSGQFYIGLFRKT